MAYALALVPVSLVLMVVYFRARGAGDLRRVAWVQPALTGVSILIALLGLTAPGASLPYVLLIAGALAVALLGDVLNVDMSDLAVVLRGLVVFCVAYLIYGVGLVALLGFHREDLATGVVLLLLNGLVVARLWSGAGELRLPVLVYSAIMFFMVWRGIGTFFGEAFSTTQAVLVSAGTASLLIGDLEFGFHLFRRPRKWMLGPFLYAGGQLAMALSCSFPR